MKTLYFTRVFLISPEFLLIISAYYFFPESKLTELIKEIEIFSGNEFSKWLVLAPVSLGLFNIKSIKASNFLKEDKRNIILEWPDYWKFKIHLLVSFIYSIFFVFISIYPLILFKNTDSIYYTYIFLVGFVGECILFCTIHFAEDKLLEVLIQFKK
ncbi:hypothetical protein [Comamonas sp.]|uniref:hypothetical protein n=1 Tax=Comamonas sp. TaxID=34028 RepID=UPI0028A2715A|nr:hypothetical protein [Comamonas sp.]